MIIDNPMYTGYGFPKEDQYNDPYFDPELEIAGIEQQDEQEEDEDEVQV
jgi:hypothetical protein